MKPPEDFNEAWQEFLRSLQNSAEFPAKMLEASLNQAKATQTYWVGMLRYFRDFMAPSPTALNSLGEREKERLGEFSPPENFQDYLALWQFKLMMAKTGLQTGMETASEYHLRQVQQAFTAWLNTVFNREEEDIAGFMAKQASLMDLLVHKYPKAIQDIEPEYGFHFDDGGYLKVAETERFFLYQVLPRDKQIQVRQDGKPVIIIPPFVLGANIMAFLPDEYKSFVHCFANQGIPTYIRIVKDIANTTAVQVMTGEEDCLDTKAFCEEIKKRHSRQVTLCGYCQGGFTAALNLLSGELDGLVDALITCVAPMDGTRSPGLMEFLNFLPERFVDLGYAVKVLKNGNQVVDGKLMSWVFKLKSIDRENPITAFYRDLKLLERGQKISKTPAAINYWLLYDVTDLPVDITRMSFASYTIPVTPEGTLPVKLFNRELNFKRIKEKGIPWLICCAEADDLVEKESAVAPLDWVEAEVAIFPKGHAAIATSWSLPTSECALDSCFLDYRGPVRFQLDLEEAQKPKPPVVESPAPEPPPAKTSTPKTPDAKVKATETPAKKAKSPAKPKKKSSKPTTTKTSSRRAN
jgi:poly(3-hydroxyalkanoate) synthetase